MVNDINHNVSEIGFLGPDSRKSELEVVIDKSADFVKLFVKFWGVIMHNDVKFRMGFKFFSDVYFDEICRHRSFRVIAKISFFLISFFKRNQWKFSKIRAGLFDKISIDDDLYGSMVMSTQK